MSTHTISTGFADLDEITSGLRRGDLIVLAGRRSNGKTILALDIARHVAEVEQQPVAVFTLEWTKQWLIKYLRIPDFPFHLSEGRDQSVTDLRAFAHKLKEKEGSLGLIVIDYLQLFLTSQSQLDPADELSAIVHDFKEMAREFDCPLIALSKLPGTVEQRDNKRPLLSDMDQIDLTEADLVALTYRPAHYEKGPTSAEVVEVNLVKHRDGSVGTVQLGFQLNRAPFLEWS